MNEANCVLGAIAVHDQTAGAEFHVVSFGKSIDDVSRFSAKRATSSALATLPVETMRGAVEEIGATGGCCGSPGPW